MTAGLGIGPDDVLLVIDVQNDFVSGSMATPGAAAIIAPINRLIAAFAHIVAVQDWHPPGHISFASSHPAAQPGDTIAAAYGAQRLYHDHCVQGSYGAAFDPRLRLDKAELVLRKGHDRAIDSYSAFQENDGRTATGLAGYLRQRGMKRVFCTGLTRYGCVALSAEGAVREGLVAIMIDDACADAADGRPDAAGADAGLAAKGITRMRSEALLG